MKVSVVTVCYNEINTIRATIKSVLGQKYDDYEYVIMDGGSEDGTIDIIKEYADDTHLTYYSEKDKGLYDAMNKSLDRISGEYVIFMNSGDMFYDEDVLADVGPELTDDIVFGDVYRRCREGDFVDKYRGTRSELIKMVLIGLVFCHQTQFTRTALMREYRFREDHRITADYDFVVRAISGKKSFKHVDRIICSFDQDGGISAQKDNYIQMIREDDSSIRECFPVLYYMTIVPKTVFRWCFRKEYRSGRKLRDMD